MRFFILSIVILILCPFLPALEILFNGRQTALLTEERLHAHFQSDSMDPDSMNEEGSLALSSLYPWLDALRQIEIHFGEDMNYVDIPNVTTTLWNNAFITGSTDHIELHIELHIGGTIYPKPWKIAVYGDRIVLSELRVWSAVKNNPLHSNIDWAMNLRGERIHWRMISNPSWLLHDPPDGQLPHLILLDDLDLIRFMDSLSVYTMAFSVSSLWQCADDGRENLPLSVDAYSPQSPLHWMLAENPDLFDDGLPESLAWFLTKVREGKTILHSETPLNALVEGRAFLAVQESPSLRFFPVVPAPDGTVNLKRIHYAAIPSGLSEADRQIAERLMADVAALKSQHGKGMPLPIDPRTLRFFKAYERIGRLVISGQMDVTEGVELIRSYVKEGKEARSLDTEATIHYIP